MFFLSFRFQNLEKTTFMTYCYLKISEMSHDIHFKVKLTTIIEYYPAIYFSSTMSYQYYYISEALPILGFEVKAYFPF